MRRATFLVPGVLALLLTASGCGSKGIGGNRDDASEGSGDYKALFETVRKADRLVLSEGLPHQGNERELFAEEKRSKKHVMINSFPFYPEPLDLSSDDAGQLKALLGDPEAFSPFTAEKKCGGFHPDYCVEWSADGRVHRCLICLGCDEVKVYGPDSGVRCDM